MDSQSENFRSTIKSEILKGSARSIISILESIFADAHIHRASDIHIGPNATDIQIRLRIDGLLQKAYALPLDCHSELIARLKILAGLRTDEHFTAHDGRFKSTVPMHAEIEMRLSILPTHFGENAVIRLLRSDTYTQSLESLGLEPSHSKQVLAALSLSSGLILVTGPTGSGKTTTLYTLLHSLLGHSRSLVSIEDPVECILPEVTQIQVQPRFGITFSNGLRSLLRQDPDIMMVGEIRDSETAQLTVSAALTGHFIFSTLHTNDARSVLSRLTDMGIEPYHLASTLQLVISQRLVRVLCSECKVHLSEYEYGAVGCEVCNGTGYHGRIGIFEILTITKEVRAHLYAGKPHHDIFLDGPTLYQDGLEKMRRGVLSRAELNRVCHD